jgi:hypothetical protein
VLGGAAGLIFPQKGAAASVPLAYLVLGLLLMRIGWNIQSPPSKPS